MIFKEVRLNIYDKKLKYVLLSVNNSANLNVDLNINSSNLINKSNLLLYIYNDSFYFVIEFNARNLHLNVFTKGLSLLLYSRPQDMLHLANSVLQLSSKFNKVSDIAYS